MKVGQLFEVAESLRKAESEDAIRDVCVDLSSQLGFGHFQFVGNYPVTGNVVVLDRAPTAERHLNDESDSLRNDLILQYCAQNTMPLHWDEIDKLFNQGSARGEITLQHTQLVELKYGLSVPSHGAGVEWGAFSLASPAPIHIEDRSILSALQFVAHALHLSVKILLNELWDESAKSDELTARETECLSWIANGKTAWEIAKILDVSESTVSFHIRNAISKMNVLNRPHAVAKALAQSRITQY